MKQEYEIVLREWEIDPTIEIGIKVAPVVLSLQQHHYLSLMEVLNNTVLLDDGCSSRFHHGLSLLTDFIHNAQVAHSAKSTPFQLRLLIQ